MPAIVMLAASSGCTSRWDSGRLHIMGRDYQKSGDALTLEQAQQESGGVPVVVDRGHVVPPGPLGPDAPTVIYVERGDEYTPYELQGGP